MALQLLVAGKCEIFDLHLDRVASLGVLCSALASGPFHMAWPFLDKDTVWVLVLCCGGVPC